MKLYGVTVVDTEGWSNGRESSTSIFTNEESQLVHAYAVYHDWFMNSDFEDGKDSNGDTLMSEDAFRNYIKDNGYIVIQRYDSHAQIEIFDFEKVEIEEKPTKTYRVYAEVTTHCYVDVKAFSEGDALEKAAKLNGGEFTYEDCPNGDDNTWELTEAYELPLN